MNGSEVNILSGNPNLTAMNLVDKIVEFALLSRDRYCSTKIANYDLEEFFTIFDTTLKLETTIWCQVGNLD